MVLIFPKDKTHDEEWIQEHLINPENLRNQEDKIFYANSDALRLEQFLKHEQEGAVRIIKKKCLEHSKPCEACLILSKRQESNRENELIRSIWENGKKRIRHSDLHHHDIAETLLPWRSNVKEARMHAKKVINKARREGSLDVLENQVEKMIKKGAFVQLTAEEILELSEKPHLFTQYNWVHSPGSSSTPFRMITNTSAINGGTTVSVEQMTPSKVLNPMTNSLVRFSLYEVPLCGDIPSAYHCILVDDQTALFCLFN